jgi:hypothetical protein
MRWSRERRLKFIDFRLYWEGRINRMDLKIFFGISTPQASADLRDYQREAPNNINYDKSKKFYYATEEFKPIYISKDSSEYLSQLRLISSNIIKQEESFLGILPNIDITPNPNRSVNPEILRKILRAIRENESLEIEYQSLSRDNPTHRRIAPHTLAYDGHRWHVHAYCFVRNSFRDFLFARILDAKDYKPSEINPMNDIEWNNFIKVIIGPHPGLTESQKRIIESDYGMINGSITIDVRVALYFYFESQFRLDKSCSERPAKEQQIVLLNRDEIEEKLILYKRGV